MSLQHFGASIYECNFILLYMYINEIKYYNLHFQLIDNKKE